MAADAPVGETPDKPSVPSPTRPPALDECTTRTGPKEIASLPPLHELHEQLNLSPRTGEPWRTPLVLAAALLGYASGAATVGAYALSWWRAAHPETFPASARLIAWVSPEPGGWLSLVLVTCLAATAALMVAAPAVIAWNLWNGQSWTRSGGLISTVIVAGGAALLSDWAWIATGLALASATLIWLPGAGHYLDQWARVRWVAPAGSRDESSVLYGPLHRYR